MILHCMYQIYQTKSHGFIDPMLDEDKVSAIVILQGKAFSSCSQARATSHDDFNRFPQQPSANLKTKEGLAALM